VRLLGPGPLARDNTVIWSRLDAANADRAIEDEIAFFCADGRGFEWKLYGHDRPADLAARLEAHGFAEDEEGTLLAFDLAASPWPGDAPAGVEFRAVVGPEGARDILPVLNEVWGEDHAWKADELAEALRRGAAAGERAVALTIAYADGRPVAASWINFYGSLPFATLWGGSTLQAYRGRGIYRHLVQVRAAQARERGVKFLTVDAGAESRPILERLGFEPLSDIRPYLWMQCSNS
jgi:GNAT superfamily N-acetyltransferase